MPTELTAEQLDAIRARHEAATPNDDMKRDRYDHGGGRMYSENDKGRNLVLDAYQRCDREFYFNAHTDTSALLSHAEALAAKVARLEGELEKATDALTETCDMIKCPICEEWTDPSSLCDGDGDFEPMCDSCYGAATHECSECSFRPSKPDDFDVCPMCEGEIVERPKEDSAHVAHD